MKRGERQTLKTNSGRQRLNLHGAIHAETHEVTVIESDTVNIDSTLRLIETLDQNIFWLKRSYSSQTMRNIIIQRRFKKG